MSQLTPQMDAALAAEAPTIFGAIHVALPDYDLRLIDGAGFVAFGGGTYIGRDPVYGVVAAIEDLSDGMGEEAPGLDITFFPANDAAAADLAGPLMQGSTVSIYLGALDRVTGLVVPDPELLFIGELDVPVLKSGGNQRRLEYQVVSVLERFFEDDEGARMADGYHQSVWPGEEGFAFATGVEETVYWGMDAPPSSVVYGGGSGALRDRLNQQLL